MTQLCRNRTAFWDCELIIKIEGKMR